MARPTTIAALLLVLLFLAGALMPGGLNWGFHALGFLPLPFTAAYAALALILFAAAPRLEGRVRSVALALDRRPALLLGGAIALFCATASLLRVAASLPGDSFTLLYNFNDFRNGTAPLAPWHEPLSIHALYYLTSLFGGPGYAEARNAFLVVHLLLGSAF